MNRDARLRQQARLKLLEGLQCEVEHGAERTRVYHRDLGSSGGLYMSTHQLFLLIRQLLFVCRQAAACGMGKGTCQNYTWGLRSSTNNLTADGECGKLWPVCVFESPFEIWKCIVKTQHWQGKLSVQRGSIRLILRVNHLLLSILILLWAITVTQQLPPDHFVLICPVPTLTPKRTSLCHWKHPQTLCYEHKWRKYVFPHIKIQYLNDN